MFGKVKEKTKSQAIFWHQHWSKHGALIGRIHSQGFPYEAKNQKGSVENVRVARCAVVSDGIWDFRREGVKEEVSLESSSYDLPFVVQSTRNGERGTVTTIDAAVEAVRKFYSQS